MRRRLFWWTFELEAKWLAVLFVAPPLMAVLFAVVVPMMCRWTRPVIATRRARDSDVDGIASIHVRSWQAVYRGLMPDEFLDRLSVADRAEVWRKVLADAGSDVLVLDDEHGRIAGFCSLLRSRDEDGDPTTGEIAVIHVDPGRLRTGLGTVLIADVMKLAAARGFTQVTLWVLEDNTRARRFYEAVGFGVDGAQKVENRWKTFSVRQVRYRKSI